MTSTTSTSQPPYSQRRVGHCQVRFLASSAIRSASRPRVVAGQELRGPLRPLQQLVLDEGAALEHPDQVLEALLPRIRRLGGADRVRHVADEGDAAPAALVRDREVGVPRDERLELDEIDAAALEHRDRPPPVLRRRHGDRRGELRLRPIQHRPRDDQPRTDPRSPRRRLSRLQDRLQIAPHVARAGDAIGEQEGQDHFPAAGHPVAEERVHVHVPEARDQELARGVDRAGTGGRSSASGAGPHLRDPRTLDDDRHVLPQGAARGIDHGDVRDHERRGGTAVRRRSLREQENRRENAGPWKSHAATLVHTRADRSRQFTAQAVEFGILRRSAPQDDSRCRRKRPRGSTGNGSIQGSVSSGGGNMPTTEAPSTTRTRPDPYSTPNTQSSARGSDRVEPSSSSEGARVLILAGGDGARLRPVTRVLAGDDRPKQFCTLVGQEPLLVQTARRAAAIATPENILFLLSRHHEPYYADIVSALEPLVARGPARKPRDRDGRPLRAAAHRLGDAELSRGDPPVGPLDLGRARVRAACPRRRRRRRGAREPRHPARDDADPPGAGVRLDRAGRAHHRRMARPPPRRPIRREAGGGCGAGAVPGDESLEHLRRRRPARGAPVPLRHRAAGPRGLLPRDLERARFAVRARGRGAPLRARSRTPTSPATCSRRSRTRSPSSRSTGSSGRTWEAPPASARPAGSSTRRPLRLVAECLRRAEPLREASEDPASESG